MAWALVQSAKTTATATNTATATCTFGSNLSTGTKILCAVAVSLGDNADVSGVADAHGNALTLVGRGTTTSLEDTTLWAMDTPTADVGTEAVITATISTGVAQWSISLAEVSGLAAGNTLAAMVDGTAGVVTGTGGSSTGSPSYASTASNEFLCSVYGDNGGPETFTKPSALTLSPANVNSNTCADIALAYGNSTNGTEAGSWAITGSPANWGTILVAFKLAASGTTINAADTGTGVDTATVSEGGSGFDSGTGADAATVTAQTTASPVFAASYSPAGATSLAVTAAQSGTGVSDGIALTVKVLTGAAVSPIGTTAESAAVTTPELAITPAGTGSWVYGALANSDAAAAYTAAGTTTFSANDYWAADDFGFGTFRSTATTTASTPVTLGATAPTEATGNLQIALLEIETSGTLAEDASSPAVAYTTTATTVATAHFAPPANSLLVAMVSSDCSGTSGESMTMEVSDSSGLTWTRQAVALYANGASTFQVASVWTAVAGSPSGGDWTTSASPKTQVVTASPGNVIVMLGGTMLAATTLGAPTGGPASWTAEGASAVAGYPAAYGWSLTVPTGSVTPTLSITTTSLPGATVGTTYSQGLTATGGTGTGYTWAVSAGSLPSWAALNASTGVISGDPAAAGTSSFTVKVTDSGGNTATQALSITASAASSTNPVGPSGDWTLVFEDMFPGDSLNTANWTAVQGAVNSGVTTEASSVSVSGGYCILKLAGFIVSNSVSNFGGPSTGPALAVGDCCEASISFPGPSGDEAYNWPAWWASGADWPASGEEDIFESYNGTPSALNYHTSAGANNGPFPSGSWCNSFHTYTLVRGETTLDAYWDGTLVRSVTRDDDGGAQSLQVLIGGGNTTSDTAETLVAYVRMWTPA